jgi:archaemetzincin
MPTIMIAAFAHNDLAPLAQPGGVYTGGVETRRLKMDSHIRIVPINAMEGAFFDRLAPCLEERFLATVQIERALAVPRSALNATRAQLFLSTLVARVRRAHPETAGICLALTDYDLYKTSHRFIYGDADETQGVAAVSLHRLRSEYYGEEPDSNLLFQRTLKESVHELGHAFGLRHCFNVRCAMYYSNSIFETDNKMSHFCESCDKRIGRARNER